MNLQAGTPEHEAAMFALILKTAEADPTSELYIDGTPTELAPGGREVMTKLIYALPVSHFHENPPTALVLPPDPEEANERGASDALAAITSYALAAGNETMDEAIGDLLCNMHHAVDRLGLDWDELIARADNYYADETEGN